jgi:hypothetical protein
MMLAKISNEINNCSGSITLKEISAKLGIEQSALIGMINFLIQKGKLKKGILITDYSYENCSSQTCGASALCAGEKNCSLSSNAKMLSDTRG